MALMAKEPSPVRFSERMEWYLAELVKLGVGKTRSELVRRFVWDGIERYIEKKLLPVKVASANEIPDPDVDEVDR